MAMKPLQIKKKAQALLELAIFGAIVISILGLLINYGLRYNYQQQVMQQTFRKALVSAFHTPENNQPVSVSHVVLKDAHISDPANTFGMGSLSPLSSGASVNRNWNSASTPENTEELPELRIEVQGDPQSPRPFKAAEIRQVVTNEEALQKYVLIYGASNVDEIGEECLQWSTEDSDPQFYERVCLEIVKLVRLIDTASGQIMDYDTVRSRCQQITDPETCVLECQRQFGTNCEETCALEIEVPWYCDKINQLFKVTASGGYKKMGLQEDYREETTVTQNLLRKTETPTGIATQESLDWQIMPVRTIIFRNLEERSGTTQEAEVATSVSQERTFGWETPKQ